MATASRSGTLGVDVDLVVMPIDPPDVTTARACEIESMGFRRYWMYDHLTWRHYRDGPWHATVPWLGAVAAATSTMRLGTLVSSPNLRHPLTMAKDAMSLDHLSGGRFVLGLGAGTVGLDATVFGDDVLPARERADRFIEYVEVIDRLLRGRTDHQGRWYTVNEGRVLPGCLQQPRTPLAIAAGGSRTIELAAAVGDEWVTLGDPTAGAVDFSDWLDQLRRQSEQLTTACDRIGRVDGPERVVFLSAGRLEPLSSLEAFSGFADELASFGFHRVVIHDTVPTDPALNFDPALLREIGQRLPSAG